MTVLGHPGFSRMLSLIEETSGGTDGHSAMLLWRTPHLEAREITVWF